MNTFFQWEKIVTVPQCMFHNMMGVFKTLLIFHKKFSAAMIKNNLNSHEMYGARSTWAQKEFKIILPLFI